MSCTIVVGRDRLTILVTLVKHLETTPGTEVAEVREFSVSIKQSSVFNGTIDTGPRVIRGLVTSLENTKITND